MTPEDVLLEVVVTVEGRAIKVEFRDDTGHLSPHAMVLPFQMGQIRIALCAGDYLRDLLAETVKRAILLAED